MRLMIWTYEVTCCLLAACLMPLSVDDQLTLGEEQLLPVADHS